MKLRTILFPAECLWSWHFSVSNQNHQRNQNRYLYAYLAGRMTSASIQKTINGNDIYAPRFLFMCSIELKWSSFIQNKDSTALHQLKMICPCIFCDMTFNCGTESAAQCITVKINSRHSTKNARS